MNQQTEYQRGQPLMAPGAALGGGRYMVRGVLGRGGMAEVRDGWDVKLRRPVAIKLLNPAIGERPENRLRFETEARAAARLTGRHVVVVHDVGEDHGLPFIVMERLPGVSLADHIARGPLAPAFVQAVLDSVLEALVEAHHAGILHRDVKPGNILFTATGEPKLSDFGIAKTAGTAYTRAGEVVGSMPYMSPERLTSEPATPADDLYAVGVVGYEALAGRRPFPQEDLGALARAILNDSPPPVAAVRRDVPPGLGAIIERAMARAPAQRFHRADAMRAALARPVPAPLPVRPRTRVMEAPFGGEEPAPPRRKLWAAAILSLLILAIMLLALDPLSGPSPTPVTTSTPVPPSTTTVTATPNSVAPQPAPPPHPGPPGPPGKGKHKGGEGD